MPAPTETMDLLRGCPSLGAYWFRPDEPNTGYFRLSIGRHTAIGSGSHTNSVRAAIRDIQRHPAGRVPIRLLVEVEPASSRVDEWSPSVLDREWSALVLESFKPGHDPDLRAPSALGNKKEGHPNPLQARRQPGPAFPTLKGALVHPKQGNQFRHGQA